ncbi:MAG TPA: VCBS repeat-containing protein [Anaeromyxobacteraceae bacterium]|nr:VCBS repeat-containing protein [Anaeromyxobacteraceae bacterium]
MVLAGAALASLAAVGCSSGTTGSGGYIAESIAVADVDGDGHPDVLSAILAMDPTQSFLSARLQVPSAPGTFAAPVQSSAAGAPVAIAVGDLNGDGLPDVAVANAQPVSGSYSVDVQFQTAGSPGEFGTPLQLSLGALLPRDVFLADLNGDGKLDIAVAAAGGNAVQVFFQQAAGAFGAAVPFAVGGEPTGVAAADLTGAGQLDLAVSTENGAVSVLLHGATPGTFQPSVDYPAGTYAAAVQIADMNGDGHPDLIVADYTGAVLVLLQSAVGDGTFQSAVRYPALDYGTCSVAVGDLDGDGRNDVVVANAGPPGYPGSVAVFLQSSTTAGVLNAPVLYQGYWGPQWVSLGDLNGDGLLDMAVADGAPYVRFQNPAAPGSFLPPTWLKE